MSTFRPGQLNSLVALSSWFWIGCRLASPSTTTMMMYGANAWNISLRVGGRPSSASFLRSSAASEVDPPAIAGRRPATFAELVRGDHTVSSVTTAAAEPSDAMMSVSSIET